MFSLKRRPSDDRVVVVLLVSVALMLTVHYGATVVGALLGDRMRLHAAIVEHTAPSPYRYRVLAPYVMQAVLWCLPAPARASAAAHHAVYLSADFLLFCGILLALYGFLRQWFAREHALIGALFTGAMMVVPLRDHYFQPWSLLETLLFILALTAMHRGRFGWVCVCAALSALNSEKGVFIPLAFALTAAPVAALRRGAWGPAGRALLLGGLWAAAFFGLRGWLGAAPPVETVASLREWNADVVKILVMLGAFLGLFWYNVGVGLRRAPAFVRRAAWVIPLYLLVLAPFSVWYEVRLLMPLYPLLIAGGLAAVFPFREDVSPGHASGDMGRTACNTPL